MRIYKKYYFDTAHFLPSENLDENYKNIHGHSYELIIYLDDKLDEKKEWVMDFKVIDNFVKPLIKELDHNLLNNIKGLENPTSENIAKWFWNRLKKNLLNLVRIDINRPRIGGCIYEP
ncbi:MAG: 6-carboxytetrahydropterin synthase QueD [Rickettsiales bacterium]|nr:6-carboxytetrahydropterin synthase QueD [Rickettsiales bacterium]|tara:strand:+ start:41194 stop:41547 length:354 start_codon:yes stop_codon:yes gene_type:complete